MAYDAIDVQTLCMTHTKADRWLRTQLSKALEESGLTMMEWLLLTSICKSKEAGLTVSEIAELLGVTLPQITALTQQLLKKGLIKQSVEPADRRSRRLCTSAEGQRLAAAAQQRVAAAIENASSAPILLKYKQLLAALVESPATVLE